MEQASKPRAAPTDAALATPRVSARVVLLVGERTVEVLDPRARRGPGRYVRFEHDGEPGGQLARTLHNMLKAHGVKARRVVVALSHQLVTSRVIELPRLAGRDLDQVMARRAAQLGEFGDREVTYSGLALDPPDSEERRWLVHVAEAEPVATFQQELRSLGYRVEAIIPARTAPFLSDPCCAPAFGPAFGPAVDTGSIEVAGEEADTATRSGTDQATEAAASMLVLSDPESSDDPSFDTPDVGSAPEPGARICVLFEREACSVGLVSDGRLVQLSVLHAGLDRHLNDVQASRSFVQELRGLDAFWRRTSRGERVVEVTIGGATDREVELLAPAIRSSLGEVSVRPLVSLGSGAAWRKREASSPFDPFDHAGEQARMALLGSLDSARIRMLDLAVALPPRLRSILCVAAVSLVLFGSLALSIRNDLASSAASISARASLTHQASADLEELQGLGSRVLAAESRVIEACAEVEAASRIGLDLEPLIFDVQECFGRDIALLGVTALGHGIGGPSANAAPRAGTLRLRGAVVDIPGDSANRIARLERRLRQVRGVESVEVEPPTLDDRAGDLLDVDWPALRFSVVVGLRDAASGPATGELR